MSKGNRPAKRSLIAVLLAALLLGCSSAPAARPQPVEKAAALNNRAASEFGRGNYDKALILYEEALALSRTMGDREGIATELINRAVVLRALGKPDEAEKCIDEIMDASYVDFGSEKRAEASLLRALVNFDAKRYDAASFWADRAISLCGGKCGVSGRAYNVKAGAALKSGKLGSAIESSSLGFRINSGDGDQNETANSIRLSADARLAGGNCSAAAGLFGEALLIDTSAASPVKMYFDLMGKGRSLLCLGKPEDAMRDFENARDLALANSDGPAADQAGKMIREAMNAVLARRLKEDAAATGWSVASGMAEESLKKCGTAHAELWADMALALCAEDKCPKQSEISALKQRAVLKKECRQPSGTK